MKKFKLINIILVLVMMITSIGATIVRAEESKDEIGKLNKLDVYNALQALEIYSKINAGGSVDEFNKCIKNYYVNLSSDQIQKRDIIDFKDASSLLGKSNWYEKLSDDKMTIDDAADFQNIDAAFGYDARNNSEKYGDSFYSETKQYLQKKLNTDVSDLKITYTIVGENGVNLTAEKNKDGMKTIAQNNNFGNVEENEYRIKVLNALGVQSQTKLTDDNEYWKKRSDLIKNSSLVCTVNGKSYYYVYGYTPDSKLEDGCLKVNLYLVSADESNNSKFDTELNYEAYIGTKDVGGKLESGTFLPSYDESNIKEDADVTATISSKNKEEIVKVNDKEVTDTPSKDQPWYYPNPEDKTKVAKQYPFDTYDNSTDNGMVSEKVTLTSSDDKTSEQNVSIKWPFRIIDKTYDPETPTDDTTEVTVTIETNLPMDPDKVPQGWTMVPNTDNHKIRKTYKKGEKIDEDVTVYQNKTGDSDKTHVKYTWPGDKKDKSVSDKIISQTGEKVSLALIIAVLAIVAAIVINKKKNNLTK